MTKAETNRKLALLREMLPESSNHRHLRELLVMYAEGQDVRDQLIDNIVGEFRALGVLKVGLKECPRCSWHPQSTSHGASYDGLLSARIEAALVAAEGRPRVKAVTSPARPASAIDCPQANLIPGAPARHPETCVCHGTGYISGTDE